MAVYTQLTRLQVEQLLELYELGNLVSYSEISAGIENTNYFLDTYLESHGGSGLGLKGRYVLTIFENLSKEALPFFSDLTAHLSREGFKVPAPEFDANGESVFELNEKPGMIVKCLSGSATELASVEQCKAMAVYLAKMHLALRDFPRTRPLTRGEAWMVQQKALLIDSAIPKHDLDLLERSILRYTEEYGVATQECPQGIVHGDLFRDNVLFEGEVVSGVIDFYHACQATLLFDLAVMVNDWAWDSSKGGYDEALMVETVRAYQAYRPWTENEQRVWPRCLELAALRFWISRLVSFHLPGYQQHSMEGDTAKNPDEMKAILLRTQLL